jgi:hypothetical protein
LAERELTAVLGERLLKEEQRTNLLEHRLRVGLLAGFAHFHGWPGASDPKEPALIGSTAQLSMLSTLLKLLAQVGCYTLELIEAPGPDYRPELADYLRGRLLPGLDRACRVVEEAAWGAR